MRLREVGLELHLELRRVADVLKRVGLLASVDGHDSAQFADRFRALREGNIDLLVTAFFLDIGGRQFQLSAQLGPEVRYVRVFWEDTDVMYRLVSAEFGTKLKARKHRKLLAAELLQFQNSANVHRVVICNGNDFYARSH